MIEVLRTICFAKIHGATVTQAELYYEGSITIDADLLEASGILPNELVQIVNLSNGSRIETYVIAGEPGSGVICLNGPAARMAYVGDVVHVLCYGLFDGEEAADVVLNVAHVDENNRLVEQ
ncbi:MAG: aspartate 1-decarboxylase [Armatimonadota bacterium]|jgi:aspartate 1-decarboxylase